MLLIFFSLFLSAHAAVSAVHRCPRNEHYVVQNPMCHVTCANRFVTSPHALCKPRTGCVCNHGLVRLYNDATGPCITPDRCPPSPIYCGPHEVPTNCSKDCPYESCETLYTKVYCEEPCKRGCKCIDNYLRNELGICIPRNLCPLPPKSCVPTCAAPNPSDCPYVEYNECGNGYILSEERGKCVKLEDCPAHLRCGGDPNAVVKACPLPCPSTCEAPNARKCRRLCEPVGCECAPGYIRSTLNGKCILPEKCPGGYPCKGNSTFVECKVHCTSDYCPVNDCRDDAVCQKADDCMSGCVCKTNYKFRSIDDETCILAQDCPPVQCTRQNEVWNSCPPGCLFENCEDVDNGLIDCDTVCSPRCICDMNYYRNSSGICVTPDQCPVYDIIY
nr:Zon1A-L [Andraca theae]